MKRITTYVMLLLSLLMFFDSAQAQSPEGFIYQAQLRNKKGHVIKKKKLNLNVMILSSPDENTVVWERLYNVKTNKFGMVSIVIEDGDVPHFPPFSDIDWGHGTYYLYIELDNGHSVRGIGDPVLLFSVPYALHAKTCDNGVDTSNLEVGDILQFNGVGYEPATFNFYYQDKDLDGYGNNNGFVYSPVRPTGFVDLGGDTDDNNPEINPGMDEVCGDGIDNNSDGVIDEFCNTDDDGDGFTELEGDCNDENELIHPGAFEIIDDGIDNNCNDLIDEDLISYCRTVVTNVIQYGEDNCPSDPMCMTNSPDYQYYSDCVDFNCTIVMATNPPVGYNSWSSEQKAGFIISHCGVVDGDGDGYAPVDGDTDDNDATIYPNSPEICDDNIDNNQNGFIDEGCDLNGDFDNDGYTPNQGDCDDINANTNPGAPELADNIDNNCNGEVDEGVNDDNDDDGFSIADGDCDDTNPDIYPSDTPDTCRDGIDNNCNGEIDEMCDEDDDGFTVSEGDCDDLDELIYPGAVEELDDIDNNCNGEIDEGFDLTDADGDGVNVAYGDCDDNDATVYPGAEELIDGIDNDCDGELDFDEIDNDGDGYIPGIIDPNTDWLGDSNVVGGGDFDDNNALWYPGSLDICDGLDNDMDGEADEDCDSDGDGYTIYTGDCDDSNETIFPEAPELIDGLDNDCDGELDPNEIDNDGDGFIIGTFDENSWQGDYEVIGGDDCNDNNYRVYPGTPELVDGIDNNCDGQLDPDEIDSDGDGFITGYYNFNIWHGSRILGGLDCDDNNDIVYPGAPELIDGIVNNCDGQLDPDESDYDGDGYISGNYDVTIWKGSTSIIGGGDCEDHSSTTYPGAPELVDGIDNNCDGQLSPDEIDSDGDGYVPGHVNYSDWTGPSDIDGGDDCNDNDSSIHPWAIDYPNDGIDQDCDGFDLKTWYRDFDGDGFGDGNSSILSNEKPDGYVSNNTDCNDLDPSIHPGATEIIGDNKDNNCNGEVDETDSPT